MQSERVTILMTPDRKARVASRAAARGISMGEYLRRKIEDEEDELTPAQEAELAVLVEQVNEAIPRMNASLDQMSETLRKTNMELDAFLREKGIRA
jgi:signal transduction protein with GAF and PtsI domain